MPEATSAVGDAEKEQQLGGIWHITGEELRQESKVKDRNSGIGYVRQCALCKQSCELGGFGLPKLEFRFSAEEKAHTKVDKIASADNLKDGEKELRSHQKGP